MEIISNVDVMTQQWRFYVLSIFKLYLYSLLSVFYESSQVDA